MVSESPAVIVHELTRGTHLLRAGLCQQALVEFRAAYAAAEAAGDNAIMASSLGEIAWACFKLGDAEQGLECAMGATWLWERLGNRGEKARAMAAQAILLLELGFNDEAYDLSGEAVELAKANGEQSILAFALNARGVSLTVAREAELGARALEQAIALADLGGNVAAQAFYLLNLGFAHAKLAEEAEAVGRLEVAIGEREASFDLTNAAIDMALEVGDHWTLRVGLANNAETLGMQGRYDLAMDYLRRIEQLPGNPGDSLQIHYLYTLGDVLLRSGRPDLALDSVGKAMQLAEQTGQVDHQLNAASKLAEVHEAMGNFKLALQLHKRFHRLHVLQSGEAAHRRARVEEIRSETALLRSRAAKLAELALSDPLTGIANRRSFDDILNRLAGSHCSVCIVDLDHFKSVNDRFSHIVGDVVLQRVAKIMVAQLGPHGHAARLGGEEFGLIFPNAPRATAAAVCEGVRVAVAMTDWSTVAPGLKVTISIGLAVGDGSQPSGELMQVADNRLYAAKARGRNCVVSSDQPIALAQADDRYGLHA